MTDKEPRRTDLVPGELRHMVRDRAGDLQSSPFICLTVTQHGSRSLVIDLKTQQLSFAFRSSTSFSEILERQT